MHKKKSQYIRHALLALVCLVFSGVLWSAPSWAAPQADLAVTMTVSNATPMVGDHIIYTISVTNNGPEDASFVSAVAVLPSGVKIVNATPSQGTYNPGTGQWVLGSVPTGSSQTLALVVAVLSVGSITSTATITNSDQNDPDPSNNAASVTITSIAAAPAISALSPNSGTTKGGSIVTITGSGFSGTTTVRFGGVSVSSFSVSGDTAITVATPAHASGAVEVEVITPRGKASLPSGFSYRTPQADLAVRMTVSNATPRVGDRITYTISVENSGPEDASSVSAVAVLPSGVKIVNATPSQGTYYPGTGQWVLGSVPTGSSQTLALTATVLSIGSITSTATITNSDQNDPNPNNDSAAVDITSIAAAPTISALSPNSGTTKGSSIVTITGSGFSGASAVTFGGVSVSSFSVSGDDTITVTTPAHASGAVAVEVTAPGGKASLPSGFSYRTPQADLAVRMTVSNATPRVGDRITYTIIVENSGPDAASSVRVRAQLPPSLLFVSATPSQGSYGTGTGHWMVGSVLTGSSQTLTLTATVLSVGLITSTATITNSDPDDPNPNNDSAAVDITSIATAPTISALSPNSGTTTGGTEVTITGSGFSGATAVRFGGVSVSSFTVDSDTAITVTTPAHASGVVEVEVTAPGGKAALPTGFSYTTPQADLAVTMTVSNATPRVGDHITYTISVTNNGPEDASSVSAVAVLPSGVQFVSVTPSQGSYSTGTGQWMLGNVATGSSQTLELVAAVLSVGSITSTATITNSDQNDPDPSNNAASVTITSIAAAPTISALSPNSGTTTGGTEVTITGSGFSGATAVRFGGVSVSSFTVDSDTAITVTTPAHASGVVEVEVTAPGGKAALPTGFSYAAPVPTITALTPNSGMTTGGTSVIITGSGFSEASAVTFGGVAVSNFTVDSDTAINVTTPAHASGAVAVEVTAPGGKASQATGFTYSVPVPTVVNHSVDVLAGTTARVDLTQGATGGPFTSAAIVTPPSAQDGTASITHTGSQRQLVYASTAGAAPTVIVRYTLSNTSGASAEGTVTFTIIARPDPSRDPEVIGLLNAQSQSAQRFAKSQITNFRDRLEQLHSDSTREAASLNIRVGIPQSTDVRKYDQDSRPYDNLARSAPPSTSDSTMDTQHASSSASPQSSEATPSNIAVWTGGFVNFGTANKSNIDLDHTLIGISGGVDYKFTPNFIAGIGLGYGRDKVDVGEKGTHSKGQAFSTAIYGSYSPYDNVFIDGLLGYSALDFDSKRFVTSTGGFTTGSRSGNQVFGSLSGSYEYKNDGLLLSPYGGVELARTRLHSFTEKGAAPYNLTFGDQTLNMFSGVLGLRAEYAISQNWGLLKGRSRLEYTHDFSGSSWASMGYADLGNGLPYALNIDAFSKDHLAVGLGFDAEFGDSNTVGFDYTTAFGFDGNSRNHNFTLKFRSRF